MYKQVKFNKLSDTNTKGTTTWKCQYGCTARLITKNSKLVAFKGSHRPMVHKAWSPYQIVKHEFEQKVLNRIKENNESVHEAYDGVRRDNPDQACIVRGLRDIRNKGYKIKKNAGLTLPKTAKEISMTLKDSGLDKNYYGQKVKLKAYDAAKVTAEQLQQWKSRINSFYLGDGVTAEYQVFCDKAGAETF